MPNINPSETANKSGTIPSNISRTGKKLIITENIKHASAKSADLFHVIFFPKCSTRGFVRTKEITAGRAKPDVPKNINLLLLITLAISVRIPRIIIIVRERGHEGAINRYLLRPSIFVSPEADRSNHPHEYKINK